MGWLGLDWGNVPGWFSAGSFMVAGYVIARDRQHKKRQQIDRVGIWGEFELCRDEDSVQFGFITPVICFKNASDLPVHVEEVQYKAVYTWSCRAHAGYFFFPFDVQEGSFAGRIADVTVPPGAEVVAQGVDRRPIECPERAAGDLLVTSRAPGSRLMIREFTLVDNAHRRWRVAPLADTRKAVVRQVRTRRLPERFRLRFPLRGRKTE